MREETEKQIAELQEQLEISQQNVEAQKIKLTELEQAKALISQERDEALLAAKTAIDKQKL